jgi:NAD(P)H-hydrate repair Nnr-like enzyme with NAD(P)H-hydrate dehydratase domain
MGDQLSGTAGAFLAAKLAPRDAAALALFFGGRAADLCERGRTLTPEDVSEMLVHAFRSPGRRHAPLPFITFDQPRRR